MRLRCGVPVFGRSFWVLTLAVAVVLTAACGFRADLISPLTTSATVIRPNGGVESETRVSFDLTNRADITVLLIGPDAKMHTLRERATRAPDRYEVRFDGTIPANASDRRVVSNGAYTISVLAEDSLGRRNERQAAIVVEDADTTPIEVQRLQADLTEFSPDGDGNHDELRITYRLTKDGEATVYATNDRGAYFAIDPWQKRRAALQSHLWDGTTGGRVFGGRLLPDGNYVIHVEARDRAGNFSSAMTPVRIVGGGTARLVITDVRFSPIAVILGGTLDVRITVRNTGTVGIHSWGPAPGYTYSTPDQNFASIRDPRDSGKPLFFERQGVWRVGVTWQNAPSTFPLRWGLFAPQKKSDGTDDWDQRVLGPGESVTVDGHIRVGIKEDSRQVRFAAGIIQEGVGFPDGRVGEQLVQVGW